MDKMETPPPGSIPNGVWAVAITPFDDDLQIDWNAYGRLIEFYLGSGAVGIFACCGSSEVFELTDQECVELTRHTRRIVNGRAPIIAGAMGSTDVSELAAQAERLMEAGADAVSVAPCLLAAPHEIDDVLKRRIERLLEITGNIPLATYECPTPYKRLINGQLFGWIASTGRFVFHKDTTCNHTAIRIKLDAAASSRLKVFNANMPTLPRSLDDGAHGYCGVATNLYPDLVVALCDNRGSIDPLYQELHAFLVRSDDVMGAAYPVSAKIALDTQGAHMERSCRMKTGSVGAGMLEQILTVMKQADAFRARLDTSTRIQHAS